MKKWITMLAAVVWTASLQAAIIASDDFSGGTAGNVIDNVAVQTGTGLWTTNYTTAAGGLNQLKYYGGGYAIPGVAVTTGGNVALSNSALGSVTTTLKMSADFVAGGDKADAGAWTIGFYETLSKAFLQNETADDFVGFRFLVSGANEGRVNWRIYDEGVSQDVTYSGSTTAFAASDVIRLSLSYDFTSGLIMGSASNVTQNALIVSDTRTLASLTGFKYAGLGFSNFTTGIDGSNPTRVTNFVVESIPEPATIGMLGLGALTTLLIRRMRS